MCSIGGRSSSMLCSLLPSLIHAAYALLSLYSPFLSSASGSSSVEAAFFNVNLRNKPHAVTAPPPPYGALVRERGRRPRSRTPPSGRPAVEGSIGHASQLAGQPHRSHNFFTMAFTLSGKKSYGHLITFKSSSSKYKVFTGSIAMDFIFEFAKNG